MLDILINPTFTLALLGVAFICLVREWSESRERERLCAGCPTCAARAMEVKAQQVRRRLSRLVAAGRCPQCFSMLVRRNGEQFCAICKRAWSDRPPD